MSSIKFTQLPQASTPLGGNEIIAMVQAGVSKQASLAALQALLSLAVLSGETQFVAVAGNNDDVAPGGVNALLVDTTAGAATIRTIVAAAAGRLLMVTNKGPNDLTLAVGVGATAANQLYGLADVVLPPKASKILSYSGVLTKWKM